MATEHPMLDDNGDRKGSLEPKATGTWTACSRAACSSASDSTPGASSPELDRLRAKKDELEERIAELRAQRSVTRRRSTCASSRPCCSIWRAPTRRSSGWRRQGEAGVAMAGRARAWGALLALLVGAASSLACGVRGRRAGLRRGSARAPAAPAKLRGEADRRPSRRMRKATARVEAEPDSLEAAGVGGGAVRGRPLPGRRDGSGGVSRLAFRSAHAGPRGIRLPLGSALAEVGRYDEARQAFEAEVEARGPDRLPRSPKLGELALVTGDRDGGDARASTRSSTPTTTARARSAAELSGGGDRVPPPRRRPIRSSSRTRSRRSTRRSPPIPAAIEPRVALERALPREVQRHRGARRGRGGARDRSASCRGARSRWRASSTSRAPTRRWTRSSSSFTINPNFVPARVFLAQLLLELEELRRGGEPRRAWRSRSTRAPSTRRRSSPRRATCGATSPGSAPSSARCSPPTRTPRTSTTCWATPACATGSTARRWSSGSARSQLEPTSWRGWGLVGLNQLREGEIEAGRGNLEERVRRRSLQRLVQEHARPGRQVRGLRHAPRAAASSWSRATTRTTCSRPTRWRSRRRPTTCWRSATE